MQVVAGGNPGDLGLGLEHWVCLKCQSNAKDNLIYIYLPFVNDSFSMLQFQGAVLGELNWISTKLHQ